MARTASDSYYGFAKSPEAGAQQIVSGPAPSPVSPSGWLSSGAQQTTHIVDLLRYLGGEVRAVFCRQGRRLVRRAGFDVADVTTAQLEFASGALGSLITSCSLPRGAWQAGVDVTADGLFLEVRQDRLRVHQGGSPQEYAALIKADLVKWGKVVKDANIPME